MLAKALARRRYSSEAFKYLLYSEDSASRIARITLNRPDVHNAFNEHVIEEITRAFGNASAAAARDAVRVVVFTGAGKSFSAGADLSWMKKMAAYTLSENERDSLQLYDMVHSLKLCPVPVVTRVNGSALGGGAGLVAASDICVALEGVQFGFTEVRLGLIPAVISPFVIERIGAHAYRYFLTGERFSTREALQMGLVQEVVATEAELNEKTEKIAREIAQNAPVAVAKCKQLVQKVMHLSYSDPQTRKYLADKIASIRVSPEGQEGLTAFLEKRKPAWQKT